MIGETLERITDPAGDARGRRCATASQDAGPAGGLRRDSRPTRSPPGSRRSSGSSRTSPADAPRRRRRPPTIPEAAAQLAAQTGADEAACAIAIKETLQAGARIDNPATGRPVFAFRLHQFLSKGDTVYVTLEPPGKRHVTVHVSGAAPGGSPDARTASWSRPASAGSAARSTCRSPGSTRTATTAYPPRQDNDAAGGNDTSGYLFISDDQPWPQNAEQALTDGRLPYSWVTFDPATGNAGDRPGQGRRTCPEPVYVDVTGRETDQASAAPTPPTCPSPFRFCLRCRTSYEQTRGTDFAKLAKLSAEGRSPRDVPGHRLDRAHAARDPGRGARRRGAASCSPSSTTGRTPACRPATSTTSSR